LAAALQRLLSDETLRKAMGAAGRQRVLQEFTLAQMAARVEIIYGEALA
jgi:glycosyltransferase involved in cell wall biosynthesis